ncbi:hypothetical protein D3X11_04230 [Streptococcus sp. X16XC17]|uniref:hypothetical protein n=1 Tax=Streptococcus sp. X16XC17 TaxID=2316646 RepID=UPI00066FC8B9|nr:hypothetical protein [Streptococcus sp. X16XC17]TCD46599.1 hypothetical protein D3X11_04230 [Streptococcus sp. X16XC17]
MRGSYLTFAARAINSFGRVGQYQEAEHRIWIMGIPITKALVFHTDADLAVKKMKMVQYQQFRLIVQSIKGLSF